MKTLILFILILLTGCGSGTSETKTLKVLVLGQSNIANYGAIYEPFEYKATNTFAMCESVQVEYESPIVCDNATGNYSTMLPYLGDSISERTKYKTVVFNNIAIGGSSVASWSENGLWNIDALTDYDLILWHQGETDTLYNTSKEDYIASFLKLRQNIRALGIDAPFLVARASHYKGQTSQDVIDAQNYLIDNHDDIKEGAETDTLGSEYRYDDIHFNERGLINHSKLWLEKILKELNE